MNMNEIRSGIQNILAAVKSAREAEGEALYKEFVAQQPRLEEKAAMRTLLEQTIRNILDLKYIIYPMMDTLKDTDHVEYRKAYNTRLKIEDSVGKALGRMGLTLSPQKYIPTEDRKTFDPKASKALKEKVAKFAEKAKEDAKKEEKVEVKTDGN